MEIGLARPVLCQANLSLGHGLAPKTVRLADRSMLGYFFFLN
jgi:hypothetical protein